MLTLSAMEIPARRLLRGTRSPWPISRLGTSIQRHGTVAINCRKGVRFVLALATPRCLLQLVVRSVVLRCLEHHVR
jgi:hypothetical protein